MLCGPGREDDGPQCVAKDPNYYNPIIHPENFGKSKNVGGGSNGEGSSGGTTTIISQSSGGLSLSSQATQNLLNHCVNSPYDPACPQLPKTTYASCNSPQISTLGMKNMPPGGCHLAGYQYDVIQWDQVDKTQLGLDVFGIVGAFAPIGGFPYC